MNKFFILALALFATVANCSATYRHGGPQVEQVRYLPNIEQVHRILGSSSSSAAASSSPAEVIAAPGHGYGARPVPAYAPVAPSYAPVRSVVAPASYAAAPVVAAPAYSAVPVQRAYQPAPRSYAPKWSVQPTYASQLYPGPTQYKSYQSPPQYSTVALPVLQSAPVAKLFIPQRSHGYGPGPAAY